MISNEATPTLSIYGPSGVDPDAIIPQSRLYDPLIASDAMKLLQFSVDTVLQLPKRHALLPIRVRQLEILSAYEDLSFFLHSALSQNREKDPERQDRHFH